MKKTNIFISLILCILFACSEEVKSINPVPKITASYTVEKISVDGVLKESVWQNTQTVILSENKTAKLSTNSTILTHVKTVYDSEFLYIAFICNDPDIWGNFTDRDQHLWTEEAVEVFIDTDTVSNTYVEIEISPQNVLFDSYIVDPIEIDIDATKKFDLANIKTAVLVEGSLNDNSDRDKQWIVEIAVALIDLVDDIHLINPGKTEWRINFYRIERDRSGKSIGYAWSPTGARFHKPEVFGILRFGDRD